MAKMTKFGQKMTVFWPPVLLPTRPHSEILVRYVIFYALFFYVGFNRGPAWPTLENADLLKKSARRPPMATDREKIFAYLKSP